ncbi:YqgE/AlgH family protein [Microbulbifer sp. S227A]|uniref:YqgE/AlgH family protein n=1 Tax=Microbulbifer sp. S227A TaxID=3415131 RepID=UPI003C7A0C8F
MDLTGKLLIAMPGMGDMRFEHAVIFLCSHGAEGAMGLIVNKPAQDVRLSHLLEQLDIAPEQPARDMSVYFGGPVEGARGFVLHSPDYRSNLQSLSISDEFSMTATLDILEDIATGQGPERGLMLLGYAGWGPGQLEGEISMNGWLTADADAKLVFDMADEEKWGAALHSLGVDPLSLSASAGHA